MTGLLRSRWSLAMTGFVKCINAGFIFILLFTFSTEARAEVNVFACEPEWGALAKEIGGEKVAVTNATTAQQDPHQVRAKPSLLAAIRKADLVICSGASLEVGWLPVLMERASGNVQPGNPGYILVANYVPILDKPAKVDRSMGDLHPEGNPHVQLDPHNIGKASAILAERLAQVDTENPTYYSKRQQEFSTRWQQNISRWEQEASSLRGMPVIAHHEDMAYLNHWLGLKQIGTLEPKPGIPPTASHLEELLDKLKNIPVKAILRTPYEDAKASEWLAEKSGAVSLELPYTVGGRGTTDLTSMFDKTIQLLKEAK